MGALWPLLNGQQASRARGAQTRELILEELARMPGTATEIADAIGRHRSNVYAQLLVLRDQQLIIFRKDPIGPGREWRLK